MATQGEDSHLQAKDKDYWEPPEARGWEYRDSPSELPEGPNLADIAISVLASRTMGE